MPGFPQNTYEVSRGNRASSKTSTLVSLLVNAEEPSNPRPWQLPPLPTALQLAVVMPVPFGPVMLRMLIQVSGTEEGRKVSGSDTKVNTFQVHSKSRSPLKEPTPPAQVLAPMFGAGPFTTPKPPGPHVSNELWVNSL